VKEANARRIEKMFSERLKREQTGVPSSFLRFYIGAAHAGYCEAPLASFLAQNAPFLLPADGRLTLPDKGEKENTARLAEIARLMRSGGFAPFWRGELLAVRPACASGSSAPLGLIERGCVRALGIRTAVVRLLLVNPDGTYWVSRRSPSKAINPGKLDNIAAGMVAGLESPEEAMRRESAEEAGSSLQGTKLHPASSCFLSRALPEGWLFEESMVFTAETPQDFTPRNTDGEVSEFLKMSEEEILAQIKKGGFTEESALAFLGFFARQAIRAHRAR
jgi:8-oxo-dGTP pyrophosphatase MutT (NUDIX family)